MAQRISEMVCPHPRTGCLMAIELDGFRSCLKLTPEVLRAALEQAEDLAGCRDSSVRSKQLVKHEPGAARYHS